MSTESWVVYRLYTSTHFQCHNFLYLYTKPSNQRVNACVVSSNISECNLHIPWNSVQRLIALLLFLSFSFASSLTKIQRRKLIQRQKMKKKKQKTNIFYIYLSSNIFIENYSCGFRLWASTKWRVFLNEGDSWRKHRTNYVQYSFALVFSLPSNVCRASTSFEI